MAGRGAYFMGLDAEQANYLVDILDQGITWQDIATQDLLDKYVDRQRGPQDMRSRRNEEDELAEAPKRRRVEQPPAADPVPEMKLTLTPPEKPRHFGENDDWILTRIKHGKADHGTFGFGSNSPKQVIERTGLKTNLLLPVDARKKSNTFHKATAGGKFRFFSRTSDGWNSQVATMRDAENSETFVRGVCSWLQGGDLREKLDKEEAANGKNMKKRKYIREIITVEVAYWQKTADRDIVTWEWRRFNKDDRSISTSTGDVQPLNDEDATGLRRLIKQQAGYGDDVKVERKVDIWLTMPCFTYIIQTPLPRGSDGPKTQCCFLSQAYAAANLRNVASVWTEEDVKKEFKDLIESCVKSRNDNEGNKREKKGCLDDQRYTPWTLTTENYRDAAYEKGKDKRADHPNGRPS